MDFNQMLQDFVNKDHAELVFFAKRAMGELLPYCKQVDPDNEGYFMLTSIILTAIGADGTLTQKEREFLREVLEQDDETISRFIKIYNKDMFELVDKFADNLGSDVKSHVLMLVLSVVSSDEKICSEETAFVKKLLA